MIARARMMCRLPDRLTGVLARHAFEIDLGVCRHFPGIWPEGKVDGPPVRGAAGDQNLRDQPVEVEHSLSEGRMSAGLVVVQAAVGIDQVDVADLALQTRE